MAKPEKVDEILESCPSAVRLRELIDTHLEGFPEEDQKAMVKDALSVEARDNTRERPQDQHQTAPSLRRA